MTEYVLLYAKSKNITTPNLSVYACIENIKSFAIKTNVRPLEVTSNAIEYGIYQIMKIFSQIKNRMDLFHIIQNILEPSLLITKSRYKLIETFELISKYIDQPLYKMLESESLYPLGLNSSNIALLEFLKENTSTTKDNNRILIIAYDDVPVKKMLKSVFPHLDITYHTLLTGPKCPIDNEIDGSFDMIVSTETYINITGKWGLAEYISHYRMLYDLYNILKYLSPNGTVILDMIYGYTNVTKHIIYFLACVFNNTYIHKSEYSTKYLPYANIIATGFDPSKISLELKTSMINDIYKALSKLNKCGEELQLPNNVPERKIFVDLFDWNSNTDIERLFIVNSFDFRTTPSMQFEEAYDNYIYEFNKLISNHNKQILSFVDSWSLYQNNNKYTQEIITLATNVKIFSYVKFCKKYKLNIPKEVLYQYRQISSDPEYISRTYFPYRSGINYKLLKITPEGYYSISRPFIGNEIIKIMSNILGNEMINLTITDVCGGNGGDSINFCSYYKFTNIVEANPIHCEVIKHNLKIYKLHNYRIYCDFYDKVYEKIKQDIIYIDPPWGGSKIKNLSTANIKLGSVNIHQLVNHLALTNQSVEYIILKLPPNFDLIQYNRYLDKNIKVSIYNIYDSIMLIVNQVKH